MSSSSTSSSFTYYTTYLKNDLTKYINYINEYTNNPKIINKIIILLESFADISKPIPLNVLPNYHIGEYTNINSFVSATIKSTNDNLLLRLYLLKLLYFKFKIPTKNSPSTERESRTKDYTNTPSQNKICKNDFWELNTIYNSYLEDPKSFDEEMFIVFYKKLFPS